MRILVLAPQPFFQVRGTPIAVRSLVRALSRDGHRIDLLVYHEGDDVDLYGVNLHRIRNLPWIRDIPPRFSIKKLICDMAMLRKSVSLMRNRSYDVIHAVEESVFIAKALSKVTGVPYVYDMDSSLPEQLGAQFRLPGFAIRMLEPFETRAIRGSVGVVAACSSLETRAREIDPGKPVLRLEDVSVLESVEPEPDLEHRWNIQGPVLMYVGNLEPYQGIDLLLEAFRHALASRSDSHLVIIGGSDSRIRQFRRTAELLEIGERTHFLGERPISELKAYLQQATILVSPRSHGTNTPSKIYSYLDSGRPVLATRMEAHTQVLDDSISVLAEPDAISMSDAMIRLLEDPALRKELAHRAKTRLDDEHSVEAFERKLCEFYGQLVKKPVVRRVREKIS